VITRSAGFGIEQSLAAALSGWSLNPARTWLAARTEGIFAIHHPQRNEHDATRIDYAPDASPDLEIIQRVVKGDIQAFEVLVQRYRSLVFGVVARHVPRGSIEDVAQEVLVRTYQSLPGFSARSSFRRWLTTIAVRSCCDFWRNRERHPEVPLSTLTEEHQAWLDEALAPQSREVFREQIERAEAKEILDYALERIAAEDRMVLSLVHLEGLPVKEAAELLGWSVIKTKVKAHRARREMRRIIVKLIGER
jgi:RNA polymerase sigma-70 factor, ECF subfamily